MKNTTSPQKKTYQHDEIQKKEEKRRNSALRLKNSNSE